jgi:hypothetical protein
MLGINDEIKQAENQMQLPFGLNGIFNQLMKQVEKELANASPQATPKGFKIQISTGNPQITPIIKESNREIKGAVKTISVEEVSAEEKARRSKLDRIEAKSNIRRLPEGIFYEIDTPGVNSIKDVVITKLEESLEVKAYSKKNCYVKTIPLKMELISFSVKNDKVMLRLKA